MNGVERIRTSGAVTPAELATRCNNPSLPRLQRTQADSNRLDDALQASAYPIEPCVQYPRSDSNRHCLVPKTSASFRWATRANWASWNRTTANRVKACCAATTPTPNERNLRGSNSPHVLGESRFERGGLASMPKGSKRKARDSNSDGCYTGHASNVVRSPFTPAFRMQWDGFEPPMPGLPSYALQAHAVSRLATTANTPGRIRTFNKLVLSEPPLPIGLRGRKLDYRQYERELLRSADNKKMCGSRMNLIIARKD